MCLIISYEKNVDLVDILKSSWVHMWSLDHILGTTTLEDYEINSVSHN